MVLEKLTNIIGKMLTASNTFSAAMASWTGQGVWNQEAGLYLPPDEGLRVHFIPLTLVEKLQ